MKPVGFVAIAGVSVIFVTALLIVLSDRAPEVEGRVASEESSKLVSEPEPFEESERLEAPTRVEKAVDETRGSSRTTLAAYAPERSISVRVVDEGGAPVQGAAVYLIDASREKMAPVKKSIRGPRSLVAVRGTDQTGRFLFEDVVDGEWRVYACTMTTFNSFSDVLTIGTEELTARAKLELTKIPDSQVITGTVLDENGEFADGARLQVHWMEGDSWKSSAGRCSKILGGFMLRTETVVKGGRLFARDANGVLRDGRIDGVRGGDRELVVRLQTPRFATFDVTSGGQNLNRTVSAGFEVERGGRWRKSRVTEAGPSRNDDLISWKLPAEPFRVNVSQRGYAERIFGPFNPDSMAEHQQLELVRLPRITGQILADGEPLEGAWVHSQGFQILKRPDAEGLFELACQSTGRTEVRASHPLLGTVTSEEFEGPEAGTVHVILEFTEFGRLAGKVLRPEEGPAASATQLFLHNNDSGQSSLTELDLDGSFDVEGLTAGTWSLSLASWHTQFGFTLDWDPVTETFSVTDELPNSLGSFTAEVESGKLTVVELDYRSEQPIILSGSVLFSYRGEWGESVGFCGTGIPTPEIRLFDASESVLHSTSGFLKGEFALGAREPGRYRVQATALVLRSDLITFWSDVDLKRGSNEWLIHNIAGRIRVSFQEELERPWMKLHFKWSDGAGAFGHGRFRRFAGDACDADAVVPSGRIEIYWTEEGGVERLLNVVHVAPDEERTVDLTLN